MKVEEITLGDIVSFSVVGNTGLGVFKEVKVIGLVLFPALVDKANATINHVNLLGLTEYTVGEDDSYPYIVVENDKGDKREIGFPWVREKSLVKR